MPVVILADNGSVRPGATQQLRQLAEQLSQQTGYPVHPVSFKHADRIPADKLDGNPAQLFRSFMNHQLSQGQREFVLLPLFFGNSKALTSFVPDEISILKQTHGDFSLDVAGVIYPLPEGEALLTGIIYDHIHDTATKTGLPLNNVVLVDHGSPVSRVTDVRKQLARTVQAKLADNCILEQAVMERREGREYDFNGALLKDWLSEKAQSGATSAIVILMFFLPGKHAGEGGDIVEICNEVMKKFPDFKIAISPLITDHSAFLSILQKRLAERINP